MSCVLVPLARGDCARDVEDQIEWKTQLTEDWLWYELP